MATGTVGTALILLLCLNSSHESITSQSTSTSIPTPSNSITPTPSQPTVTPSHAPHITPAPVPKGEATSNTYILHSKTGSKDVCLRMVAMVTLIFDYNTKNGKSRYVVPLGSTAIVDMDASSCQLSVCADPMSATLVVDYQGMSIALDFDELGGNNHWRFNSTTVSFIVSEQLFPNLSHPDFYGKRVSVTSRDSLFDWTTQELRLLSSYSCRANTSLGHFSGSMVDEVIQVSLTVAQQQVQAFKFSSKTGFDEAEQCYADSNIIVPVIVAVLLALLATGVLLATLCKFCWKKHKESTKYTPLSANVNYD